MASVLMVVQGDTLRRRGRSCCLKAGMGPRLCRVARSHCWQSPGSGSRLLTVPDDVGSLELGGPVLFARPGDGDCSCGVGAGGVGKTGRGTTRLIRTHLMRLRRKLGEDGGNPRYVFAESRVGYRMERPDVRPEP